MPHLPFEDRSFDLVLSSHLLFTHTDRLDGAFHLQSLLELARLTHDKVRASPLLGHGGRADEQMVDRLRGQLAECGVDSEVRRVGYEFQRATTRCSSCTLFPRKTAHDRLPEAPFER